MDCLLFFQGLLLNTVAAALSKGLRSCVSAASFFLFAIFTTVGHTRIVKQI